MNYICPVCNFAGLSRPPIDWLICPCCGTEFENDDRYRSHGELRADWLDRGAPWFSKATKPPVDWDAFSQVVRENLRPPSSVDCSAEVPVSGGPVITAKQTAAAGTVSYAAA